MSPSLFFFWSKKPARMLLAGGPACLLLHISIGQVPQTGNPSTSAGLRVLPRLKKASFSSEFQKGGTTNGQSQYQCGSSGAPKAEKMQISAGIFLSGHRLGPALRVRGGGLSFLLALFPAANECMNAWLSDWPLSCPTASWTLI